MTDGDDQCGRIEKIYVLPRDVRGVVDGYGERGQLRNFEADDARGQAMV